MKILNIDEYYCHWKGKRFYDFEMSEPVCNDEQLEHILFFRGCYYNANYFVLEVDRNQELYTMLLLKYSYVK